MILSNENSLGGCQHPEKGQGQRRVSLAGRTWKIGVVLCLCTMAKCCEGEFSRE